MSIPRRIGRLASGLLSNIQEDERVRERLRTGRERGETLRGAFEAALRGAQEELRRSEERRRAEGGGPTSTFAGTRNTRQSSGRASGRTSGRTSSTFAPLKYPPNVLSAYDRLGLVPGVPMDEVDRKRRELVKRFHPDRFPDPDKRARAEKVTAEINAAHDTIERHASRKSR